MELGITAVDGPKSQAELINKLAALFSADERLLACWLIGSFAAGTTDEYSDIDMALAVDDEQFHHAFQHARNLACGAGKCLVAWDSPKDVNGAGFTAFYSDCNFLDVKVYRASRLEHLDMRDPVRILFDRGDLIHPSEHSSSQDDNLGPPLSDQVRWKMVFFWICVYSSVRFLMRREYWYAAGMINSIRGTMAQLFWLWTRPDKTTDMSFVVWGVVRKDLDSALVSELAGTVSQAEQAEMIGTLGKLIEVFERYGKRIAQDTGAEYPEELVQVVAEFYRDECLKGT